MRYIIAAVLVIHGIAHLAGVVVPWKLLSLPGLPYDTTPLADRLDIGMRIIGLLWLATGLLFFVGAVLWVDDAAVGLRVVLAAIAISLPLCISEWPRAHVGVLVNIGILVVLVADQQVKLLLRS